MYFVANKAIAAGAIMSAFGPFATAEGAIAMIEKFPVPGEYVVYGPAAPMHAVTIAAPQVTSGAL